MSHQQFKDCIDACVACAVACTHCATSCLQEEDPKMMAKCIQMDLECAAICRAAAELMSLGSGCSHHLCRVCADLCNACAEECGSHDMDHCQECAAACRACAQACEQMATAV
ncbi:MAG: four-helix bundle copper-binding protein [Sphingobacteriaceae bacterium]|nr:four-helix bundle copper-binding protein [Sphingobacteriaceae bacterium]